MIHAQTLRNLAKFTKLDNNFFILDLGTGSGGFLYHCKKHLTYVKLRGVEYDPRLVEIANKNLEQKLV